MRSYAMWGNGVSRARAWTCRALSGVITGVPSPADIGYDAKRNRVLVPIFTGNRMEVWQLQ